MIVTSKLFDNKRMTVGCVLKLYRRLTNKVRGKYENLVAPKNIILCSEWAR